MELEELAIGALTPYAKNSRTHSAAQVEQIANSINEFGFTNPILVDESNTIIAGHGRLLAAQRLGMANIPVIRLEGLSDEQKRAYVIADNQLALNAGWDLNTLKAELAVLDTDGFDVDLLGFDSTFIDDLLSDDDVGLVDPDSVPDVMADAVSVVGDIWLLGDHRAMCGDSTQIDAVMRLTAGRTAQLLHADPPYGMGKEADGVENDNLTGEKLDAFQMEWWTTFRLFLADNASAYIWGNAAELWRLWYRGGLEASEPLRLRNEIVWDKGDTPGMKSGLLTQYPNASERCLYIQLGRKGAPVSATGRPYFDNAHSVMRDTWTFGRATGSDRHGHATPKPVDMMERVMLSSLPRTRTLSGMVSIPAAIKPSDNCSRSLAWNRGGRFNGSIVCLNPGAESPSFAPAQASIVFVCSSEHVRRGHLYLVAQAGSDGRDVACNVSTCSLVARGYS